MVSISLYIPNSSDRQGVQLRRDVVGADPQLPAHLLWSPAFPSLPLRHPAPQQDNQLDGRRRVQLPSRIQGLRWAGFNLPQGTRVV